jgi:hypothetical protein
MILEIILLIVVFIILSKNLFYERFSNPYDENSNENILFNSDSNGYKIPYYDTSRFVYNNDNGFITHNNDLLRRYASNLNFNVINNPHY